MRVALLLLVSTMLSSTAWACSCLGASSDRAALELDQAEVVFYGYLLEVSYGPLQGCVPGGGSQEVRFGVGSFKVVDAIKGTEPGSIIVATLSAYPPIYTTRECEVGVGGDTCQAGLGGGAIITDPRLNAEYSLIFQDKESDLAERISQELDDRYQGRWVALRRDQGGTLSTASSCEVFGYLGYDEEVIEAAIVEYKAK